MKKPKRRGVDRAVWLLAALASLWMLGACGSSDQDPKTDGEQAGAEGIVPINHPALGPNVEPKAKQTLEAQKLALETLAGSDQQTDRQALGEAYGAMGSLYFSYRFLPQADACLRNAIFLQPDNFRWRYFLGHLYRERNDLQQAAAAFQKAHELNPEYAPGIVVLAQTLRQQDKQEQARALFQKAVDMDPANAVAFMGLGQIASADKKYDEAIAFFGKALATQARATAIHYSLALAYRALENHEEAERHMKLRGDIEPFLVDPVMDAVNKPRAMAHYRMAETLRLAGKHEDAVQHYELVVELEPVLAGARVGRALNYIAMGRYFNAAYAMQDDLTVFPNMAVIHHMLARLSASSPDERVRDGKRSLRMLDQLRKSMEQPTAEMTETLAMAFAEDGRFDDAVLAQERAIAMAKQAGDDAFAARMEGNLALYKQSKPCRLPWPKDDNLFKLVTYGK